MPNTLTGLVLFVALLVPGFLHIGIRKRLRPTRNPTAFQEVSETAVMGILSTTGALALFAIIQSIAPTVDIRLLIESPRTYVASHAALVFAWGIGILVLATVAASTAAFLINNWDPHSSTVSSWWVLFDKWWDPTTTDRHVGCVLDDGGWIEGTLGSFNMSADDSPERDLILVEPKYRAPDAEDVTSRQGAACVSAQNIVALFVTYAPRRADATSSEAAVADRPEEVAVRQPSDHGPPSVERTDAESPAPDPV